MGIKKPVYNNSHTQTLLAILLVCFFSIVKGQQLSVTQRDSIKTVMERVGRSDQQYRWTLSLGELDAKKLDSLKALPYPVMKMRRQQVEAGTVGFSQYTRDSLWQLQKSIDANNKQILLFIMKAYGYPSNKRIGGRCDPYTLILHLVSKEDFEELLPLFRNELSKGNMPPAEFASWYDRCQLMMEKKQLYGEYIKDYPCVNRLEETNEERKKIGLQELKTNNCR